MRTRTMMIWIVSLLTFGGLYWWLVQESHMPDNAAYEFNIDKVRQLANSLPGDKPTQLRYEHVASFEFARAMVMAGDAWNGVEIPVYAFEVVYADRIGIIDTAMNREIAKPEFMVPFFDDKAYQRVIDALDHAAFIAVTHEHLDHIGGLLASPHLSALKPVLQLTGTQLAHPENMDPAKIPPGALDGYQPLNYVGLHALSPGVVLIAAPGHTPGSQMVYVKLASGAEVLLLGDVSWQQQNIALLRERPRFMTAIIGENRTQVLGEFQALHALALREPAVHQVPGHDGAVVAALTSSGVLQAGFIP